MCFTANCRDDTFQIGIVLIRAHRDSLAIHFVGDAVVKHVGYNEDIIAPHGLGNGCFGLSRPKSGKIDLHQIGWLLVTGKGNGSFVLAFPLFAPLYDIVVYLSADFFTTRQRNDSQLAKRD